MVEPITCPLPEVEAALAPYIHTRQETARIRQVVTQCLADPKDGTPLSRINLYDPNTILNAEILGSSAGVRKAYNDALIAHRAAKERHEALRREVDALVESAGSESERLRVREVERRDEIVRQRIEGIRSEQRDARVRILAVAVADLEAVSGESKGLKKVVRECDENKPQMISLTTGGEEGRVAEKEVEDRMSVLKKELVRARKVVDSFRRQGSSEDEAQREIDPRTRVGALRVTRDKLVQMIEEELVKLPSEDDPDLEVEERDGHKGQAETETKDTMDNLYQKYISQRRSLVNAIDHLRTLSSDALTSRASPTKQQLATRSDSSVGSSGLSRQPLTTMTSVFPQIQELVTLHDCQASLQAQQSYLKRQLSHAAASRQRSTIKLADQSLLVEPGVAKTKAWVDAAAEAKEREEGFVRDRIGSAEDDLKLAEEVLERLK